LRSALVSSGASSAGDSKHEKKALANNSGASLAERLCMLQLSVVPIFLFLFLSETAAGYGKIMPNLA